MYVVFDTDIEHIKGFYMWKLNLRAFHSFSNLAIIINYWEVTNKCDRKQAKYVNFTYIYD